MQGIRVRSNQFDKKHALARLDKARTLYAKYESDAKALATLPGKERAAWREERIECLFDYAAACARFGIYENQPYYWHAFWGERDEFLAETAGEDDFDEYHSYWQTQRKRPIGLRLDADGRPIFPTTPGEWRDGLSDDQKILFLLKEARDLDTSADGKFAALSLYRQAMLARSRFGMDRLNAYARAYYVSGKRPIEEDLKRFNPWEMTDDESLILAGGTLRKASLPDQWNVFKLLRVVAGDYARADSGDDAQYAVAAYYQTRQQYNRAIGEYERVEKVWPGTEIAGRARNEINNIRNPEVRINRMECSSPATPRRYN